MLLVAGFLYGGFHVANESIRSEYPYTVYNDSGCPGHGYGSGPVECNLTYCAFANNSLHTIVVDEDCPGGTQPWLMTCFLAGQLYSFRDQRLFNMKLPLLEMLGQASWEEFREHSIRNAPAGYISENPDYFGCLRNPAVILITIIAILNGAMGFGQINGPIAALSRGQASASRMLKIIQRASAVSPFDEGGQRLVAVKGELALVDVFFAYPSAPDHTVCRGYSLSVPAGQTVALCGPSGSGKSTIIALIERFYDPQMGSVLLDGVDLRQLNVRWLRQQLGLVSQEPVLFMGTVSENIGYGKDGATTVEIETAAKMANAHNFITRDLNDGYDTQVGMRGGYARRTEPRAFSSRARRARRPHRRVLRL